MNFETQKLNSNFKNKTLLILVSFPLLFGLLGLGYSKIEIMVYAIFCFFLFALIFFREKNFNQKEISAISNINKASDKPDESNPNDLLYALTLRKNKIHKEDSLKLNKDQNKDSRENSEKKRKPNEIENMSFNEKTEIESNNFSLISFNMPNIEPIPRIDGHKFVDLDTIYETYSDREKSAVTKFNSKSHFTETNKENFNQKLGKHETMFIDKDKDSATSPNVFYVNDLNESSLDLTVNSLDLLNEVIIKKTNTTPRFDKRALMNLHLEKTNPEMAEKIRIKKREANMEDEHKLGHTKRPIKTMKN